MEPESDKKPSRLILFFSGLAADEKLFALQKRKYENLITPPWLPPNPGESLQEYTRRWLDELTDQGHQIDKNTLIGGASFGGLIAQQLAREIGSDRCILFGSIKSRDEIPFRIRCLQPIHGLAFGWIIRFWQFVIGALLKPFGKALFRRTRSVLQQFCKSDASLVKWSIRTFFAHTRQLHPPAPTNSKSPVLHIHQLHGKLDSVFPIGRLLEQENSTLYELETAGHLLTLSHADDVNAIIDDLLEPVAQQK